MNPIHTDFVPMARGRGRTNLANPTLAAPITTILPQSLMPKVMTFTGIPTPVLWKPSIDPHKELRRPLNNSSIGVISPVGDTRTPSPLSQHSPVLFTATPPQPFPTANQWSTVTEDPPLLPLQLGRGVRSSNPYRWVKDGAETGEPMAGSESAATAADALEETSRLFEDAPETWPFSNPAQLASIDLTAGAPVDGVNRLAALNQSCASAPPASAFTASAFTASAFTASAFPAGASPAVRPDTQRTREFPAPQPFTPPHRTNEAPHSAGKNRYKWTRDEARAPSGDAAAQTQLSPRSKLSVEAKEFVPRSKLETESEEAYRPIYKKPERARQDAESSCDRAVRVLRHAMNVMSAEPASFHRETPSLVAAFGGWLGDEAVADAAVSALVERAVLDANFRFNGSRLCAALNAAFGARFRNGLMDRCRCEHERTAATLLVDPERVQGFVAFAADLYVTLETAPGSRQRISALGGAVLETLAALLNAPTHEHVKCVCHTLKLAGYHLESCDPVVLGAILRRLEELCADPRAPAASQALVAHLLKLRQHNWGIGQPEAAAAVVAQTQQPPAVGDIGLNEPTFYGPDGMILSSEESEFLQDQFGASSSEEDDSAPDEDIWVIDDEMDEEIQAAFEQFLLTSKPN